MFEFELPEKFRRFVPLAVWTIVTFVLILIPFKILGYGYLPGDDALRHVAKAVSGKPWTEILVLGDTFKMDHNLGWHAILSAVHHVTGWNAENMLIFSVVALFLIVNGVGMGLYALLSIFFLFLVQRQLDEGPERRPGDIGHAPLTAPGGPA